MPVTDPIPVPLKSRLLPCVLAIAGCGALIAVAVMRGVRLPVGPVAAALTWYDPLFLQYNIALGLLAVLIVPLITFQYVRAMRAEKVRRLERDLSARDLELFRLDIERLIPEQFRISRYCGSLTVTVGVIALGVSVLLLSKPYFPLPEELPAVSGLQTPATTQHGGATGVSRGVDYGRGGNMLLLGPFIELRPADPRYYHQIVISLTGFQFGFLGAYIYFIGSLLRAYFTLDLSPHTFVAGSLRMIISSVLALVLSFALPALNILGPAEQAAGSERFLRLLPLLAFFLGYFPNRALFLLEKTGNDLLGVGTQKYSGTPLAQLAGMSGDHEVTLDREGFDNVENLSHARPIELALRTGFSYRQLRQWVEEARLRLQLGGDYEEFFACTGVRTAEELVAYWDADPITAAKHLQEIVTPIIFGKLAIIVPLLRKKQVDRLSSLSSEPLSA